MNGSSLKSDRPASRTRTLVLGSALSRLAIAHPAEPPPTMTMSYLSTLISAPSRHGSRRDGGSRPTAEPVCCCRRQIPPDVFGLAVLRETVMAELTSETGLLVTAPLRLRHVGVIVVDPYRSGVQTGRHSIGFGVIAGPNGTGQAVVGVVRQAKRLFFSRERLDSEHRAKRLVLDDVHLGAAVVEDGRQVEEASSQVSV